MEQSKFSKFILMSLGKSVRCVDIRQQEMGPKEPVPKSVQEAQEQGATEQAAYLQDQ